MDNKNSIVEMRTRQISLKTFLNDHEQVFNTIKEFESLHKYCHGERPRSGDLIYPCTTPPMCEYLIKFEGGYDKDVITMNCAIHEDDYIPTVFVLFLFNEKPNNELLNRFGYMFTEHMIHAFMDKGPGLMDIKRYIESHISRDNRVPFMDYYYYLKQKYYGGKQ
jgi:hypothetical protein